EGNVDAAALLDDLVAVHEGTSEHLRKPAADRGFSGAHGTDEEDALHSGRILPDPYAPRHKLQRPNRRSRRERPASGPDRLAKRVDQLTERKYVVTRPFGVVTVMIIGPALSGATVKPQVSAAGLLDVMQGTVYESGPMMDPFVTSA